MSGFRRSGPIPELKGGSIPTNWLYWDTETKNKPSPEYPNRVDFEFRLGCATYVQLNPDMSVKRRHETIFYHVDEFISFIEKFARKKTKLYVLAHNIRFDIMVLDLIQRLHQLGYESEPPAFRERLFIWDVKMNGGKVTFLDTSQFGVISVEKLGQDMGYPKLKVDFDNVTNEQLIYYCKRDVEILEKFMVSYAQFIYNNNLGEFKLTLASQSLCAYRTNFMSNPPYLHSIESVLELERKAYSGGRTECFHIGQLPNTIHYGLDVNSMYPYVMRNSYLPQMYLRTFINTTSKLLYEYLKLPRGIYYIIADVTINTERNCYPIIHNARLVFPIGKFRCQLHHAELVQAMQDNSIIEVHQMVIYRAEKVFTEYIDFFYKLKQEYSQTNNKSWYAITKLFLNSLYGKFGQLKVHKVFIEEYKGDTIERYLVIDGETGQTGQELNWFGKVYREYRYGESVYSFPALAGAVTAEARMHLYHYMKIAEQGNYFYCDTDSLLVNYNGYKNLFDYIDSYELGALKVDKIAFDIEIHGNKDYRIEFIEKTKGVPKNAIPISANEWSMLSFGGFIEYLNRGGKGGARGKNIIKGRRTTYRKGIVNNDGSVSPFRFG